MSIRAEAFRYSDGKNMVVVTYGNLAYFLSGVIGGVIIGWILHGIILS